MTKDPLNLIWIDMEMTGLDPGKDSIIEIATIVTDKELNILAEGPVFAIYQEDSVLAAMDEWNQQHHGASGLIKRVRQSSIREAVAERETIAFLEPWVPGNASPMCGNSICQDRRFLHRHMPKLEAYFHYRNLDVSSLKELVKRWQPTLLDGFQKKCSHQAQADIIESIEELKYYRQHFLKF